MTFSKVFIIFLIMTCPGFVLAQRTAKQVDGPRGPIAFYQFLPPGYGQPDIKHPVIIFLHGIGEKGTGSMDDLPKINCCGMPKYIDAGHNMRFTWNGKTEEFVVLAPQLYSRYGTWENYFIDEMIEYARDNLNIDTNRIFATGLSLGAGGIWVYASSSVSKAKKLAGIAPVVSPCFMTNGCNIANANLPVLAVHALNDDKASYLCTMNAIKSINDCGAEAKPNVVLFEKGGHYVWKKEAFDTGHHYMNPNMYEWMLAQNRNLPANIKPIARVSGDTTISSTAISVLLDASTSSDPDGRIVRYVWQKISGPPYGTLSNELGATCKVSDLTYPGVYTFQVKAIDDRAEWDTEIVKITVVNGQILN